MAAQFDIDRIRRVLRDATAAGAPSMRGLSKAAGEQRDCVSDILSGRNNNPTTRVLANLARAMDGDLSLFGLSESRADPPTVEELEAALLDVLPGMPRGSVDRRARYLANTVADVLRLPPGLPTIEQDRKQGDATDAPPQSPTS